MQVKIESVVKVTDEELKELNEDWNIPMQVIKTNMGEFIENTRFHAFAHWKPTDYKELIGQWVEVEPRNMYGAKAELKKTADKKDLIFIKRIMK